MSNNNPDIQRFPAGRDGGFVEIDFASGEVRRVTGNDRGGTQVVAKLPGRIVKLTQAEYDALTPPEPGVVYLIVAPAV